jgi:hypothetical protein
MTDAFNPTGNHELGLGFLANRIQATAGDAIAARLFAAVEQGIDELVRAAGWERDRSQRA